ncbi:hypothetical protein [Tepidibacillus marianensis]|uniref:hypothetical protein n=1 Tax=Tepidibacillus marianensis TaxID=3131995 RepID=UPI0030CDA2E7
MEVPWAMKMPMAILALMVVFLGMGSKIIVSWLASMVPSLRLVPNQANPLLGTDELAIKQTFSLHPLELGFVLIVIIAFTWGVIRLRFRKPKVKVSPTWGCGIELDSNMEYTATSFTYAILKIFKWVIQPVRIQRVKGNRMNPQQIHYRVGVRSFLDLFLYRPLLTGLLWIANQFKKVQNGNIQTYLLFMFATLILFLLFVK